MATNCEYCGQLIENGSRFCANCGAPVTATQTKVESQESTMVSGSGNYSVILVSLGNCTKAAAADLLEDTLGYSEAESSDLFLMLPAQVAQMLNNQQANYLAQAMTEYGMEVSVSNGSGFVTVDESAVTGSVFDNSGSFLGKVLSVLGTISGLNRMRKFRRLDNPRYYEKPYRPKTYKPAPPVHVRRNIHKVEQPRPMHGRQQNGPSVHQPPKPRHDGNMHPAPSQHHPQQGQMHTNHGSIEAGSRPNRGMQHDGGAGNPHRH